MTTILDGMLPFYKSQAKVYNNKDTKSLSDSRENREGDVDAQRHLGAFIFFPRVVDVFN
ncbi:hypothetical protein HMPREF1557_01128 [Streptococcus sobrinus W1703]|uniref:Uncharacterized protein n=1 Tax=Streptococcus sobrinus W1703 TaxID=1227275 RepID=U2KGE2_9STRE|nr:hypothetical protein HMPREF1557_01128 [Streptococcus sobrinus W1703]